MDDFSDWIVTSLPKEEKPVKPFTGFSFCKKYRFTRNPDGIAVDSQNSQIYFAALNQANSEGDQQKNPQSFWSHYRHRHHQRHAPPAAALSASEVIDAQGQLLTNQSDKSCRKHWHHKYWERKCKKENNEVVVEPVKEIN